MALRRILVSVSNNSFRWGQLKKIPVGTHILTTNRAFSIMADPAPGNQVSLIAAVQLTCGNDKDKNMKLCNSLIEQAVAKKVKMVFLPEAFDFIGSKREETLALAETLDGPVISNYRDIAKKLNVWLSLGGFHLKLDSITQGPRVSNVHLIIDCNGEIVAQYSKVHLFDVSIPEKNVDLRESNTVKAGSEIVPPVTSPVGNIGLAICYDLRFPEFSDKLRRDGAEILTYPSAFTIPTGEAHWEPLLRARAIENQCFVVAAAQVGSHNDKRRSYGHSMIINPWGKILAEAGPTDQLILADIDLKSLQQIRRDMPVLQHKRMNSMGTIKRFSIPQDNVGEDLFEFGHVTVKTKMIFLESNLSRAFVNKKCILPGHVLVISKRKVNRLHLLSDEEVGDLFLLAQKVGIVMEKIHGSTAANVACQDGKDAGQSVAHVHIHVLPRRPGDLARSDQIHEDLEKYVHDEDPPKWRTEEDMLEESNHIRSIIRNDFSALLALN